MGWITMGMVCLAVSGWGGGAWGVRGKGAGVGPYAAAEHVTPTLSSQIHHLRVTRRIRIH